MSLQLSYADELQQQLQRARRLSRSTTDSTTFERLHKFADDLQKRLQLYRETMRSRDEIRSRAWHLWNENGRPAGRDDEFWLRAEAEILGKDKPV